MSSVPPPRTEATEREFFIDNLLVRIDYIIVMIKWTGLAPWEFEFPFPGSLTSIYLTRRRLHIREIERYADVRMDSHSIPTENLVNPPEAELHLLNLPHPG